MKTKRPKIAKKNQVPDVNPLKTFGKCLWLQNNKIKQKIITQNKQLKPKITFKAFHFFCAFHAHQISQ
jgi:hypothetical protein